MHISSNLNLDCDIASCNLHASEWLSQLLRINYDIDLDLTQYLLVPNKKVNRVDFSSQNPDDLYRNSIHLINGLWEYGCTERDAYNRTPFSSTIQSKYGIAKDNLVHQLLKKLVEHHGKYITDTPSKMIISHDIDTLHNGWKYEMYRGLKNGDLRLMSRVLLAGAIGKPIWYNFDIIMELLDRYDFKSIFYFITRQGRSDDGIKNADYSMKEPRVSELCNNLMKQGFEIGLHKSSLESSLNDELHDLPDGSIQSNRHHYLRFRIPELYRSLSVSSIHSDSSLCFPYEIGFRNSYGLPFMPFDLERGKTLDVLEIPFQMMCGKLNTGTKAAKEVAFNDIITFFENNRNNAVLGMLWHNTDLSEVAHKYRFELFKDLLKYLHESTIEVSTISKIMERYSWR